MSKKQNYKDDPTTPKVLKVRCGDPNGGGKGALANENQAFTLAVTNDQVLFQPVNLHNRTQHKQSIVCFGVCGNDSNGMKSSNPKVGFYEAETSRTLDTNGGNPTCSQGGLVIVEAYGMDAYNQELTKEKAHTLRTPQGGDNTAKVIIMTEYHPNDSRMRIDDSGTCQTLTSRMGTGGNNVPCVLEAMTNHE